MQFYEWRLTGVTRQPYENHVFVKYDKGHGARGNPRTDCFVSLCEHPLRGRGGHSGENKSQKYCERCRELAPIFEAEAQEEERARVAHLELNRAEITAKVNDYLSKLHIDNLLRVPGILERFFDKK